MPFAFAFLVRESLRWCWKLQSCPEGLLCLYEVAKIAQLLVLELFLRAGSSSRCSTESAHPPITKQGNATWQKSRALGMTTRTPLMNSLRHGGVGWLSLKVLQVQISANRRSLLTAPAQWHHNNINPFDQKTSQGLHFTYHVRSC